MRRVVSVFLSLQRLVIGAAFAGALAHTANAQPGWTIPQDLTVDFGPAYGIWKLENTAWSPLHGFSAVGLVSGDLDGNGQDDLVVNFGPDRGVYAWMNHASWQLLHASSPTQMVTADLNRNGKDDVLFVFPGYGIWRWSDGSWNQLHALDATRLAVGQVDGLLGDDLVVDFPGYGLYVFANNTTWTALHSSNATAIVIADLDGNGQDEVVINFGASYGLWAYRNNSTWNQIHSTAPTHLAAGDIDGSGRADLVIDFGPSYGLWTFRNNTTWVSLHPLSAEDIILTDRDGSGTDDIVIDFGATFGLWQYTNETTWVQLHTASPQRMAAGSFLARGLGQVRVLYAVPQDRVFRPDYFIAVRDALQNLQSWYRDQLAGKTFSLFKAQPETCRLAGSVGDYAVDSWSKVLEALQDCAPVATAGKRFTWVVYADVIHTCNAPGRLGAGTLGLTMMPRQDLEGLTGASIIDDCGTRWTQPITRYIGGAGHELGHALGLPHPPGCDAGLTTCDYSALMWAGYVDYPKTYFRADDKASLSASPFIK